MVLRSPHQLMIRLLRKGCANRPFYHIIVVPINERCVHPGIEQLGVYDPMPNERNERLISLNIDRLKHYVAEGSWVGSTVGMLLGDAGVLPIHPHSLTLGWRQREWKAKMELENSNQKAQANT